MAVTHLRFQTPKHREKKGKFWRGKRHLKSSRVKRFLKRNRKSHFWAIYSVFLTQNPLKRTFPARNTCSRHPYSCSRTRAGPVREHLHPRLVFGHLWRAPGAWEIPNPAFGPTGRQTVQPPAVRAFPGTAAPAGCGAVGVNTPQPYRSDARKRV